MSAVTAMNGSSQIAFRHANLAFGVPLR